MTNILTCKASKREVSFGKMVATTKRLSKEELKKEIKQSELTGLKRLETLLNEQYYKHPENRNKKRRKEEK